MPALNTRSKLKQQVNCSALRRVVLVFVKRRYSAKGGVSSPSRGMLVLTPCSAWGNSSYAARDAMGG